MTPWIISYFILGCAFAAYVFGAAEEVVRKSEANFPVKCVTFLLFVATWPVMIAYMIGLAIATMRRESNHDR